MRAIPVPQPIGDAANPANFNNKDFPTSAVREVETGDTIYPAPDPENDVLSNEPGGANATAHRQGQKTLNVGSDTLQFPLDAANPAYSGRITFELRKIETISLNTEKMMTLAPLDNVIKQGGELLDKAIDASLDAIGLTTPEREFGAGDGYGSGSTANRNSQFADIDTEGVVAGESALLAKQANDAKKSSTVEDINNLMRGKLDDKPVEGAPKVNLFFPLSVQIDDTVDIGSGNLGGLGAAALTGLKNREGIVTGVSNAVAKGFSDIFQYAFGGLDEDTARFVAAKAGKFGPQGIQTAVSVANQVSVNPNTRAVFNTVNLRAFSFTFKMIPNSAQEAQEIQKIVKHFRSALYPEILDVGGLPLGYKFPPLFRITFKHRGSEAKIPRLELCYLRGIQSTYNPTGQAFYRDGQPNEIDMTLQFQEYRTLHKADIEERGF